MLGGNPKRHLSGHGLTSAQYRERYGLKSDYPLASYAEMRRGLAKKIGLGRRVGTKMPTKTATKPAAKRGRPAKMAEQTPT
jgi:predicted transcriptional regulator